MRVFRRKRVGQAESSAPVAPLIVEEPDAPRVSPDSDARLEAEVLAALDVVAQHAEAGRRAQEEAGPTEWAPPQLWSQPAPGTSPMDADAEPAPVVSIAPSAPATIDIPTELLRVLDAVTSMCDHVIEYIEQDRSERPLMIEALTRLNRSLGDREASIDAHPSSDRERVIGGTVDAGPDPLAAGLLAGTPAEDETVIDLRQEDTPVEVRCRFGDRWVEGFEICEVLHDGSGIRYRLRRRVDSVVLPDLFAAADIRHMETFEELTSERAHPRHWSPL
jgi:hypothetical protein